jgi:hypothetical protein
MNTVQNAYWRHLAQERFQWRFPVNIYFAFRIRKMKAIPFTSFANVSLTRNIVLIGVVWTLIIVPLIIIKLCLLIKLN